MKVILLASQNMALVYLVSCYETIFIKISMSRKKFLTVFHGLIGLSGILDVRLHAAILNS